MHVILINSAAIWSTPGD